MLKSIARQMLTLAEAMPWKPGMPLRPYRRALSRGLVLTCYHDTTKSQNVLILERVNNTPSEREVAIVRDCFSVPSCAEREVKIIEGQVIVILRWTVYVQKNLFHSAKE